MTSEFSIAVHALTFLNHKERVASSEEVAKNVCTNAARIRRVMSKLKKADLVETKEGIDGGYFFHRKSSEVNLAMIAEALQVAFVSVLWNSGNEEMDCLIASDMGGILSNIYHELDRKCYEWVENITIEQINSKIFNEEKEE